MIMSKCSQLSMQPANDLTQNVYVLSRNCAAKIYSFAASRRSVGDTGPGVHGYSSMETNGLQMIDEERFVVCVKIAHYRIDPSRHIGGESNRALDWVQFPSLSYANILDPLVA